jgi:hypothetical protein
MKHVPARIDPTEHWPVAGSQTPASWQKSAGGHVTGSPLTQVPAPSQASDSVQELLSLQAVPFGFGTFATQTPAWQTSWAQALTAPHSVPSGWLTATQPPVFGSHATLTWQTVGAGHSTGAPPQTPAEQASPVVQGLPSSQARPSAAFGLEHVPVAGSHVPAAWH